MGLVDSSGQEGTEGWWLWFDLCPLHPLSCSKMRKETPLPLGVAMPTQWAAADLPRPSGAGSYSSLGAGPRGTTLCSLSQASLVPQPSGSRALGCLA